MTILDLSRIDTTPGTGWAAPPEPIDDYRAWARERYQTCRLTSQRLQVVARMRARRADSVALVGAYAEDLAGILDAITARARKADKAGRSA